MGYTNDKHKREIIKKLKNDTLSIDDFASRYKFPISMRPWLFKILMFFCVFVATIFSIIKINYISTVMHKKILVGHLFNSYFCFTTS